MNPTDIEIECTFLPPERGGRSIPALSGYRGQFYYDNWDWDVEYTFSGVDAVNPGETATASVWLMSPQYHFGNLVPGKPFLIREGNKTVAYGIVKRIVDLEQSARKGIGRLIENLDNKSLEIRLKTEKALETLTGQNFGSNHTAWKAWYEKSKEK